jgi:hypothetical protein
LWLKPSFYKHIIHKCKGTPCLKVSKEICFLTKTFFWDVQQSMRLCVCFRKFWINIKHVHHLNYMKTLKISFSEHFFGTQICVSNYVIASYFVMQKGHVILWLVCVFHQSFSRCLVNNTMFCNLASHTLFISQEASYTYVNTMYINLTISYKTTQLRWQWQKNCYIPSNWCCVQACNKHMKLELPLKLLIIYICSMNDLFLHTWKLKIHQLLFIFQLYKA